jgi:hypothetical protein
MKKLCLILWLTLWGWAQPVAEERLRAAVQAQFGRAYPYYTVVPYQNTAFAAVASLDSATRESTGQTTRWAVYEYLKGRWSLVFTFQSQGADADEESLRLDQLFAKHRFSSAMRGKLMYGEERRF